MEWGNWEFKFGNVFYSVTSVGHLLHIHNVGGKRLRMFSCLRRTTFLLLNSNLVNLFSSLCTLFQHFGFANTVKYHHDVGDFSFRLIFLVRDSFVALLFDGSQQLITSIWKFKSSSFKFIGEHRILVVRWWRNNPEMVVQLSVHMYWLNSSSSMIPVLCWNLLRCWLPVLFSSSRCYCYFIFYFLESTAVHRFTFVF